MVDTIHVKESTPKSYYTTKTLVSKLRLEVKKNDRCIWGCVLFYDNEFDTNVRALKESKFCTQFNVLYL